MSGARGSFLLGRQIEMGGAQVTIAGGAGSASVTFRDPFLRAPEVLVAGVEADSGTLAAASITRTGFSITLTGTDLADGYLEVPYVAVAKG